MSCAAAMLRLCNTGLALLNVEDPSPAREVAIGDG
jgi:hypothetical protein